ncbi:MAG: hypothetical protein U9R52_01195 [Candidatus Omnitrophota bacterium]|nr:hypothetical protein [Candidatus Omnitrophota bacterium]
MENIKLNGALKKYFAAKAEVPEKKQSCPPAESLEMYASGKLGVDERRRIGGHVKNCKFCDGLIEDALFYSVYAKHVKSEAVPDRVKNKAKSLNPAYKIKEKKIMRHFKRNIWLALSLSSLAVSFFTSRYFMQFIILTVIFGFKWIFNGGSTRALIMIYNAWKKHDKEGSEELEKIFKGRL